MAFGAPAVIDHFNNAGWKRGQELLGIFREKGFSVSGEIYHYAARSTANTMVKNSTVLKGINPGQRIRLPIEKNVVIKTLVSKNWNDRFLTAATCFLSAELIHAG